MRDGRKNVRVLGQRQFRCARARRLLDLLLAGIGDAPVSNGGSENRDIGRQCFFDRRQHVARAFDVDDRNPLWIGHIYRPADQGHIRAGRGYCCGDRMALLARRAIGDVPHRIDRLVGRSRRDKHALAGERTLRLQ
jgi:hypothetical protein